MSSRVKLRASTDICADCSAPGKTVHSSSMSISNLPLFEYLLISARLFAKYFSVISHCVVFYLIGPEWASLNRCVLICDECCSVHRSLGRHVSQVKHLRHSVWHPNLLTVQAQIITQNNHYIFQLLISQ